ncbi:MAG: DNA alkylation repair protein [Alphaproteobacteria bacterium]|nr:MAG: DNA alkylation repair protein [Alphaproteobacteria bacterium]
MAEVPASVLRDLAAGRCESVNLMEWLAADMAELAQTVAQETSHAGLRLALERAAPEVRALKITGRLILLGDAIAGVAEPGSAPFEELASHRSDLVRQWACYAAIRSPRSRGLAGRMHAALPFAADPNMSVRETAWMAFRPYLAAELSLGLGLLENVVADNDPNIRRFGVEVSRPRSVWGAHLAPLKADPSLGRALLERVRRDPSRYVQLAAGNWLNDAAKTAPDWVRDLARDWSADSSTHTHHIIRRGLRSLTVGSR